MKQNITETSKSSTFVTGFFEWVGDDDSIAKSCPVQQSKVERAKTSRGTNIILSSAEWLKKKEKT